MNFIDKYRLRKLLRLREEVAYYEEELEWAYKIENDFNKQDVEIYKDNLYELLAYASFEIIKLRAKLEKNMQLKKDEEWKTNAC